MQWRVAPTAGEELEPVAEAREQPLRWQELRGRGGDVPSRRQDLLEVVDEQEQLRRRECPRQLLLRVWADLGHLERLEDRARDVRRLAQRGDRRYRGAVTELRREPPDELERQPRLADAACSSERDQAYVVVAHELGERGEPALPSQQWRGRNRRPPRQARPGRRHVQRRVVREDRPLELAERLARLDPELVHECPAGALRDGERVGLSPGTVEREHQLPAEPLPQP